MANIFESIFRDIGGIFKKLFAAEPKITQVVIATITVIAPLVETILVVTGQEVEARAVELVIEQVETDLTAITALVQSSGVTPTLTSVLNAVVENLESLLTAGQIKDPNTIKTVTATVGVIVGELKAIIAEIAALKPVPAPKPVPVPFPTPVVGPVRQ